MLEYHKKLKSYITVGAISNFEKNHYGNIIFKNNRVKKIEEKIEKIYECKVIDVSKKILKEQKIKDLF
jgi:hypothetical protein